MGDETNQHPANSLANWTEVESESDEEVWKGPKTCDEMSRDEDYFLIDSYLTACALTEKQALITGNDKRISGEMEDGSSSKRTKS